jgi:hypothetical protein
MDFLLFEYRWETLVLYLCNSKHRRSQKILPLTLGGRQSGGLPHASRAIATPRPPLQPNQIPDSIKGLPTRFGARFLSFESFVPLNMGLIL